MNPIFLEINGNLGKFVVRRRYGSLFLSKKPEFPDRVFTPAQLAAQEHFRQATAYGRSVMANPELRQVYENAARQTNLPLFSLPVRDYCNPPVVEEIDLGAYDGTQGSRIMIGLSDDLAVVEVRVLITDDDGGILETGSAVRTDDNNRWVYTLGSGVPATRSAHLTATATDTPGHTGERSVSV
jgi:hypothetical protein